MLSGATAAGQTGKGKDSTFPLQILLLLNQNSKKKLNKNSAYQQQLQQEQRSAGFCPTGPQRHSKIYYYDPERTFQLQNGARSEWMETRNHKREEEPLARVQNVPSRHTWAVFVGQTCIGAETHRNMQAGQICCSSLFRPLSTWERKETRKRRTEENGMETRPGPRGSRGFCFWIFSLRLTTTQRLQISHHNHIWRWGG